MRTAVVVAALALALSSLAAAPALAQNRMKACAAEWKTLKASNQTGGKSYSDFRKECLAKSAAATGSEDATKTDKPKKAKSSSGGRAAATARQRECGAEWKADKAAGKIADGMKWPQYWSECNKRKKAASG
jgi:hypothetical protein